jgi:hypothetical protein
VGDRLVEPAQRHLGSANRRCGSADEQPDRGPARNPAPREREHADTERSEEVDSVQVRADEAFLDIGEGVDDGDEQQRQRTTARQASQVKREKRRGRDEEQGRVDQRAPPSRRVGRHRVGVARDEVA